MKNNNRQSIFPPLRDNFNRTISYIRLALTDRCNLRCTYCMPAEGIGFIPHEKILTYEELSKLSSVFVQAGIRKIRITGGEPFVRKGVMNFITHLKQNIKVPELHITTNGVETYKYVSELAELGISGINLSLDTLNPDRFVEMTRRNSFNHVMRSIKLMLEYGIPLKINCVVQSGKNTDELTKIAALARENPIQVRFIEEMPFNGKRSFNQEKNLINAEQILQILSQEYPSIAPEPLQKGTAKIYQIDGFKGTIGIIGGYSRSFCGSCNRLRITSTGIIKTCLYDNGAFNLKEFLQDKPNDAEIYHYLSDIIKNRYRNGFEAEKASFAECKQSMAMIGG
ncbi:MAG: GTP 3',8-cyclase MoaA [Calditrichia bacterium]